MTDPHQPPDDEQTLPLGRVSAAPGAPDAQADVEADVEPDVAPDVERTLPQARAPAGPGSERTLPLDQAPVGAAQLERSALEGRLAELRYAAQMCAAEQLPVPEGALEELRTLEAQLKQLRTR